MWKEVKWWLAELGYLLLPCGFLGLNTGHQAWLHCPLPNEPSCQFSLPNLFSFPMCVHRHPYIIPHGSSEYLGLLTDVSAASSPSRPVFSLTSNIIANGLAFLLKMKDRNLFSSVPKCMVCSRDWKHFCSCHYRMCTCPPRASASSSHYAVLQPEHCLPNSLLPHWHSWSWDLSSLALHPFLLPVCHRHLWERHDPLCHHHRVKPPRTHVLQSLINI